MQQKVQHLKRTRKINIHVESDVKIMNGGLTPEEREISDHIVAAWNGFIRLRQSHPNDKMEFHQGIHILQKTLGMRVLRRDYPDFWLDKGELITDQISY